MQTTASRAQWAVAPPPMPLRELLQDLPLEQAVPDVCIRDLALDSRQITPQCLFVALRGAQTDARQFIPQAERAAASAVVFEQVAAAPYPVQARRIACIGVVNLRQYLPRLAARFFRYPSKALTVVGITGTNGKTTCAYLLSQAYARLGRKSAFVGTLGVGAVDALAARDLTTADAVQVQRDLYALRRAGFEVVCMEASSHGLHQGRVEQVDFDLAVLTNISREHLDYHRDWASYAAAKQRLFESPDLKCAVLNATAKYFEQFKRHQRAQQVVTYAAADAVGESATGDAATADWVARQVECDSHGIRFEVQSRQGQRMRVNSPLLGRLNLDNLLATLATLVSSGVDLADAVGVFPHLQPPPGRMERFGRLAAAATAPALVVDYAHTPDALQQALAALRALAPAQLWCVFGCGGERDRGKRPMMGQIAAKYADHVIVTNDNPRGESPAKIVQDIVAGMPAAARQRVQRIFCRRAALQQAFEQAEAGDVVLVAGRGHEKYQHLATGQHRFCDREFAHQLVYGCAFSFSEAARITAGTVDPADARGRFYGVSIDTRSLLPGQLFVAIAARRDGHDFVDAAFARQAAAALVSTRVSTRGSAGAPLLRVKDTTQALGQLAAAWRNRFTLPLVGITGSNGKTTVTAMLSSILNQAGPCLSPHGSLNNQWGLPLTLLRLTEQHTHAVLEMGMNHPGELAQLSRLARPAVVLINNAAAAHLQGLGSVAAVARAKSEILHGLTPHGCAVLNADDAYFDFWRDAVERAPQQRWLSFGTGAAAQVRAAQIRHQAERSSCRVRYGEHSIDLVVPLPGQHNLMNALAAAALAIALGMPWPQLQQQLQRGLDKMRPPPRRLKVHRLACAAVLIDDSYNANPASMAAAIDVLGQRRGRKVLVLGGMAELGETSFAQHRAVGELARRRGVDALWVLARPGTALATAAAGYRQGYGAAAQWFESSADLHAALLAELKPQTTILVKGSRAAAMEQVVEQVLQVDAAAATAATAATSIKGATC